MGWWLQLPHQTQATRQNTSRGGSTHYCHPESVMSKEWSVALFQYMSELGVGKRFGNIASISKELSFHWRIIAQTQVAKSLWCGIFAIVSAESTEQCSSGWRGMKSLLQRVRGAAAAAAAAGTRQIMGAIIEIFRLMGLSFVTRLPGAGRSGQWSQGWDRIMTA